MKEKQKVNFLKEDLFKSRKLIKHEPSSAKNIANSQKIQSYKFDLNSAKVERSFITQQKSVEQLKAFKYETFKSTRFENKKSQFLDFPLLKKQNKTIEDENNFFKHKKLNIKNLQSPESPKLRDTHSTLCQSPKNNVQYMQSRARQFKRIRLLGEGKFGSVYLVKHMPTGMIAALKIMNKTRIFTNNQEQNGKILTQLTREIKIQMFLDHPNLIKLYDFFADEENVYLLMELACNGQLYEMLQAHHKFSEETTAIIAREIISGICYMHSKSIIHRDLKLENIVFTHGMAKICDFGWSVFCPKEFRSTLCGTPLYLSPEILKGNQYNQKIDIWAIGAITHELATSENPFGIKNREDLSKIITKDFQMKYGSPELRSFVNFILRKNPSKRPDADIILLHPFIQKYQDLETSDELCHKVVDQKSIK